MRAKVAPLFCELIPWSV